MAGAYCGMVGAPSASALHCSPLPTVQEKDHEQGFGPEEERKEETRQDDEGKKGGEEGQEGEQGGRADLIAQT
jgi:hypothetical protein